MGVPSPAWVCFLATITYRTLISVLPFIQLTLAAHWPLLPEDCSLRASLQTSTVGGDKAIISFQH